MVDLYHKKSNDIMYLMLLELQHFAFMSTSVSEGPYMQNIISDSTK